MNFLLANRYNENIIFDNYFVVWDDFKRFIQYEKSTNVVFLIYSGNLSYPCSEYQQPLKNSIETLKILEV